MLNCPYDMAHDACNCCFSFWTIFFPFTPLTAQKNKISKKWKKTPGDAIILHMCTTNYDKMMDVQFLRYGGSQVNGQEKWHTEVTYAPPKNFITLKYQVMIYYKNFMKSTLLVIGPKDFSDRG